MSEKELLSKIDSCIPRDGEWWCSSSQETYHNAGKELLSLGMETEEIVELLSSLYFAAAEEFGGY